MQDVIQPISGHAILVLLVQLTLLLVLARVLAEVMRRLGQPAVIGELLAGLILGPTILGHFAPDLFEAMFPREEAQFHLLEVISWMGMVLLLLLTGLETDLRDMRNLGRAAVMASFFGMVVPFASGLGLGWMLPDEFLVDPADRAIFAAFLATAMAISAMPVIAKILIDLDMIRRNVGMVILSAGVVDDTVGWLILSIIAGVAAGGAFSVASLGVTLLQLALFLAAVIWVAYPVMGRLFRFVNERVGLAGADITLILGFTFLSAAVTEAIGVHAVFGAFVAGLLVRQLPRVKAESVHVLETFVLSALSPVFFAYVGLRVDLWTLSGWGLPLIVIGIAIAGKLVGCYLGGRLGRLSHWESLALGFGMNARGAMELIVALIGLSLGLLTQELYATIVLVAVVTSFMAPLLLRWALPHIELGEDERRRIEHTAQLGLLPAGPLRVLVPTAGGSNAMAAFELIASLAQTNGAEVTALFVEGESAGRSRRRPFGRRREDVAGTGLETHLERAGTLLKQNGATLTVRRLRADKVGAAILREAARDYDLVFLGAASRAPLHDALAQEILNECPSPVVIVRSLDHDGEGELTAGLRLLVPIDGSLFSRYAAELAFAYAAAAAHAHVTLLHVTDARRAMSGSMPMPNRRNARALARQRASAVEAMIREEMRPLSDLHEMQFSVRVLTSGAPAETIIDESASGHYDLLLLGAENKTLTHPLLFGQGTADIVERAGCTTVVVVPRLD